MAGPRAKRKRPYGEGGYRKIGEGRYKARITLPDGSRPSKSGSLADVQGWLNERVHDLQIGVLPPKSTTVAAYATTWLSEIALEAAKGKAATPRSGTMTGYRRMVNNYLIRGLGGYRMEDIGKKQIVDLNNWLREGHTPSGVILTRGGMPLKAQTLVHFHHLLKSLFARAEVDRVITRNPMAAIKAPGIPDDEDFEGKAPSVVEWRRLLECAEAVPNGASVIAAAILGTRRGEVLGLTWDDLHLSDEIPWLTIEQSLQRVTGKGLVPQKAKTRDYQTLSSGSCPKAPTAPHLQAQQTGDRPVVQRVRGLLAFLRRWSASGWRPQYGRERS